jgi:DNA-binding beta-propeller fold protein YncE
MSLKFLLIPVIIVLFGCSSRNNPTPINVDNLTVFPPPPDTARIQYLTSISSSADIAGQPSFLERYVLGEAPSMPIHKPYGIATKKDKIYVCDTMLPGLEIIDLAKNTFDYFTPTGLGKLQKPVNCALDTEGRLYVADTGRRQIIIFSADGKFLKSIGDGITGKPTDVCVYKNELYVCDLDAHVIKVYDEAGKESKRQFPQVIKNHPHYLYSPTNIFVHQNLVYVTDTGDARVKVFSIKGEFVKSIGGFGERPGQFVRPKGLEVDPQGNIFVVDAAFENIQIFDADSRLLMFFGGRYEKSGSMWLPAGITIDRENLDHFKKYVYAGFNLKYLILMTNQYGPDKINVYGFVN